MDVRIAVLDKDDAVCTYLDNNASDAMHYYNDTLHTYLQGSQYTLEMSTFTDNEDSQFIVEGNHCSFKYKDRGYYLTIVNVEKNERTIKFTAYGLSLELTNEEVGKCNGTSLSFEEYIRAFGFETKAIHIGINEVSEKRISHEWDGTDTVLSRLFSLANVFDSEIEFVTELSDNYSLKRLVLNIYRKHTEENQGIGDDNSGVIIRYGSGIDGITKTSDISEIYTAIRPYGRDGLTLASVDKMEYDASGNLEYSSPRNQIEILAIQARDRFPSNAMSNLNDRYIAKIWEYDTDNVNVLYGQALGMLKRNCVPKVSYEVDGYIDGNIGDTYTIEDAEFRPVLYAKARIAEQKICFTNPTLSKTIFDNFTEMESQISSDLLKDMQKLIDENKVYVCSIITDNGIIFKNGKGTTTMTASVMDDGKDITDDMTIIWSKDGREILTEKSVTVNAEDINGKAVYRFEAADTGGKVRGSCETTVIDLSDGEKGEDAISLYILSSNGNIFKNNIISTSLTVTIFVADKTICSSAEMKEAFGEDARIEWEQKLFGQDNFIKLDENDIRLSDNGFILTLSPNDVEKQTVFNCRLLF